MSIEAIADNPSKLIPTEGTTNDLFGSSIDISRDVAIVGAPKDGISNTKSASYIFNRDATGQWHQTAELQITSAALLSLDMFTNALGPLWDLGMGAWDNNILMDYYNGNTANHVTWEIIDTGVSGRDEVIQVNFANDGANGVFFIRSLAGRNLSNFSSGRLVFDLKVPAGGPSNITFKVDCRFPCGTGDISLNGVIPVDWQSFAIDIDRLIEQGLDIHKVIAFSIFPQVGTAAQQGTSFQIDNIRWELVSEQDPSTQPPIGSQPPTLAPANAYVLYEESGVEDLWGLWDCCGGTLVTEEVATDPAYGTVIQLEYTNNNGTISGLFRSPSKDISAFAGGTLEFDAMIISHPTSGVPWKVFAESSHTASIELNLSEGRSGLDAPVGEWHHYSFTLDNQLSSLDKNAWRILAIFPIWQHAAGGIIQIDNIHIAPSNGNNDDGGGDSGNNNPLTDELFYESYFGHSVAIDTDVAIIGATGDDMKGENAGAVYIFSHDGLGNWSESQKLSPPSFAPNTGMGNSIDMSNNIIIVGASGDDTNHDNAGAVFIYDKPATTWEYSQTLSASDAAEEDAFGNSVAIDGNNAIIGAPGNEDNGNHSGSAYIFSLDGTWSETQKLTASDSGADDQFGHSVALSNTIAVVGAPGNNGLGAAYLFKKDHSGNWQQINKLVATDAMTGDNFGHSVAINGDKVVIGANGVDDNGVASGAIYVFAKSSNWEQIEKITPADGAAGDGFGQSVAIWQDTIMAGAFNDDDNGTNSGSAYSLVLSFLNIPMLGNLGLLALIFSIGLIVAANRKRITTYKSNR